MAEVASTASDRRYRAFISYSHADQAWADWLHKALETYRVPSRLVGTKTAAGTIPRRLTPVFRDRDELASAADLGRKVNEALAESANLVVICSPRAAASRWVNEEVLAWKRLGRGDRIFCLIVDGEPNASDSAGREAGECFVPALRFAVDANGGLSQQRTEPIAADARDGKDGRANAKLKLIAGILDVGFDALKQREQQRRYRRLAAVAALALVMMAVTSVLAVQAMVARTAAERRQQQSEDLINYMLGDLNDKLFAVGRLDIMQGVADKAMAYFAALPSSDVSDTALAQRATALQKIGGVRRTQGSNTAAMQAFQAAARINAQRLENSPDDADRKADYAQSLTYVGYGYWYQQDFKRAGQNFSKAISLLQAAARAKPGDIELANKLANARNNLGHVLETQNDYAGAKSEYESVLRIFEDLRAEQPENTDWQREVAYANNSLGQLLLEHGDLEQTLIRYRADQRIKTALASQDPRNQAWKADLAVSDAILAGALIMAGETAGAAEHAAAAVEIGRTLMEFDPENAERKEYFALYSLKLGSALRLDGRPDDATAPDAEALRKLTELAAKAPGNADLLSSMTKAQLENARMLLATGKTDAAQGLVEAVVSRVQPLLAKDADDRNSALALSQAYRLLGDIAAAHHDPARAQDNWRQSRDHIAKFAQSSGNPEVLDAWASALLLLDAPGSAKPVVARLQASGYRNPDFVALVERKQIAYPINEGFKHRIAEAMR